MSIPKVIHYCWFGGSALSETAERCLESWRRFCPDYEIIRWDETNYDVHKIPYISEAYEAKKWAFVSDYARLDVVYSHGGIYLDTDVELVRKLDELLEYQAFFALEKDNCQINSGLGFGAQKNNTTLKSLMEIYHTVSFVKADGSYNLTACPVYATNYFTQFGFLRRDCLQEIGGSVILPSEYFCPMDYKTGIVTLTKNTFGVHLYEASWFSESDKHIHKVEKKIRTHIPGKIGEWVCFAYRKGYRLIEYSRNGTLIQQIHKKVRR